MSAISGCFGVSTRYLSYIIVTLTLLHLFDALFFLHNVNFFFKIFILSNESVPIFFNTNISLCRFCWWSCQFYISCAYNIQVDNVTVVRFHTRRLWTRTSKIRALLYLCVYFILIFLLRAWSWLHKKADKLVILILIISFTSGSNILLLARCL